MQETCQKRVLILTKTSDGWKGDAARGKLIGMKAGLPRWEPVLGSVPKRGWGCPGLGECGVGSHQAG